MKKRGALWKIAIHTTPETEDAATDFLQQNFPGAVSSYLNIETNRVDVAVYVSQQPPAATRKTLTAQIARFREAGLDPGRATVTIRRVRHEDWAHSWKRHFRPLQVSRTLLIKPGWNKLRPRPGQAVVILDPGLSFGTGQHPTTGFCLREVDRFRRQIDRQPSFLDIGTGSGILAIAAAKLGYSPVESFDFDPEAVRVAGENARRNGVGRRVRIGRADLTQMPVRSARRHDLICANLISNLLIAERRKIVNRLRPGGLLVIAGVLKREFHEVQHAFESLGLRLVKAKSEKEWRSGSFARS
jgi:ribosomal protein L11 methyltransferase